MRKRYPFDSLVFGLPESFDFTVIRAVGDVQNLFATLPNRDRGSAALGVWNARAMVGDKVAFDALMEAWDHDHREVAREFGGEAEFAKALRMVAPRLKLPSGRAHREAKLGGIFLFRGTFVPPDHEPANHGRGIAWTFDRDAAAWFAIRYWGCRDGRPWVFQLEVHPAHIVAVHHGRDEAEAIIDATAFVATTMTVDIDGTEASDVAPGAQASAEALASWQEAADRYEAAKRERQLR
jgi:hypothetical protein